MSAPRARPGPAMPSQDRLDCTPLLALRVSSLMPSRRNIRIFLFLASNERHIPPARPPSSPCRLCPPRRHPAECQWPPPTPARARGPSAPRVRTPRMSFGPATPSQDRTDRAPLLALQVSSLMPSLAISASRAHFLDLASDMRPIPSSRPPSSPGLLCPPQRHPAGSEWPPPTPAVPAGRARIVFSARPVVLPRPHTIAQPAPACLPSLSA